MFLWKSISAGQLLVALIVCILHTFQSTTYAWSPNPFSGFLFSNPSSQRTIWHFDDTDEKKVEKNDDSSSATKDVVYETRRRFLNAAAMNVCFLGGAAPAIASDTSSVTGVTRYISGKPPQVPGAKEIDKSNVKGTRKDPDFLRSIADCRNQCQNSASGPDGLAKSKEDCLSECQDICCKTYEQCTFNIVPRI